MLLLLSLLAAAPETTDVVDTGKDKLVCKPITRTGSRLPPRKVCKPADEWRIMSNRARNELGELQRKSQVEQGPVF